MAERRDEWIEAAAAARQEADSEFDKTLTKLSAAEQRRSELAGTGRWLEALGSGARPPSKLAMPVLSCGSASTGSARTRATPR